MAADAPLGSTIEFGAIEGNGLPREDGMIITVGTTTTTNDATGKPSITGAAQVGRTLTAATTGISDADGKTKAEDGDAGYAYTYQWVRVDGSANETNVGSNSSTYTPATADVGKKIKVKVSFTDDHAAVEPDLESLRILAHAPSVSLGPVMRAPRYRRSLRRAGPTRP